MSERKPYLFRELREPVPEKEKGIFEPFDRLNRWTGNKSKDLAIASGVTTLVVPGAAFITLPVALGATFWHVGDRIQGEVSKSIRGHFEKAKGNKPSSGKTIYTASKS